MARFFGSKTTGRPFKTSILAGLLLILTLHGFSRAEEAVSYRVLVLYSFHDDLPWQRNFKKGFKSAMTDDSSVRYFEENLDSSRFPDAAHQATFSAFLSNKYQGDDINMIVAESEPASLFLKNNPDLLPDASRFLVNPSPTALATDDKVIVLSEDVVASFDAMLSITGRSEIYIVGETNTPYLGHYVEILKTATDKKPELRVTYLVDLDLPETLTAVEAIPETAAIFYLLYFRDTEGGAFIPRDVAKQIVDRTKAPVFSLYDTILGTGVVGGLANNSVRAGELTGIQVRNLLADPEFDIRSIHALEHIYDFRALDRFGITVSSLPADSIIVNQPPGLWSSYRELVLGSLLVILTLLAITLVLAYAYEQVARSRRFISQSSRHLERAQTLAHIGSWHWNSSSDTIEWSDETYRIFGIKPQSRKITINNIGELIHPDDRDKVMNAMTECATKETPADVEFRIHRSSGDERIVHGRGTVVADSDPELVLEGTIHDITELRYLQNDLFTAQRLESVGRFAGGIAHHFNNLFTVVLGNSEILRSRLNRRDGPGYIDNIVQSIRAAADMNSQLLTFSRNQSLIVRTTNLTTRASDIRRELAHHIRSGTKIEFEYDADLWEIPIDYSELITSLHNLIQNAIEAMQGPGNIKVSMTNIVLDEEFSRIHAGANPGKFVKVSVVDDGPGMSQAQSQRAFDPFYTTKDVGDGSGLGLSMVYGFVKQLNGYTLIESVEGDGTAVSMYFPQEKEAEANSELESHHNERQAS